MNTNQAFCEIDIFGDFASRSTILNTMTKKQSITPEQSEYLRKKRLNLSAECFYKQVKKKKIENVKLLLSYKVSPNRSYYSEYPVYAAAKNNDFEMLKLLMENGAKLDRGFYSELYEAVKHKNNEMAQYLLDNGAKVNYTDSITNSTIIYYAIKYNMLDIAAQMIQKGVAADMKTARLIQKRKLQYLIKK